MTANGHKIDFEDGYVFVRGFPVELSEILAIQLRIGGDLFDESVYRSERARIACAQVIRQLDMQLGRLRFQKQDPNYLPDHIDGRAIGDGLHHYIPFGFKFNVPVKFGKTKDRPTSLVGWFRRKRRFGGITLGN